MLKRPIRHITIYYLLYPELPMKGRLISSDPYRQQFLLSAARSLSHRQRDCSELISVLPRHTLQQIDGFGGSLPPKVRAWYLTA